jgi:hypothetical protein
MRNNQRKLNSDNFKKESNAKVEWRYVTACSLKKHFPAGTAFADQRNKNRVWQPVLQGVLLRAF